MEEFEFEIDVELEDDWEFDDGVTTLTEDELREMGIDPRDIFRDGDEWEN